MAQGCLRILLRYRRGSAFSQSRLHSAKLKQAWLCAHWHEMSRKKSTIASWVVDLISCIVRCGVKGLNMRFCIRVPDSVHPWGRGSRRRCGGTHWLLSHRVSIKIRHWLLPERSPRVRRYRTRKRLRSCRVFRDVRWSVPIDGTRRLGFVRGIVPLLRHNSSRA